MKHLISGLVVLMSVVLSACGAGDEDGVVGEENVNSVEQAFIPYCGSTSGFDVHYYSNSSKTTEVGRWDCEYGTWVPHGTKTPYYEIVKWAE